MRVVVTGAAGFLGRHVVAERRAAGAEVVGIDRRAWVTAPGEVAVVGDVVDPRIAATLHTADVVVHLAGAPGVRSCDPGVARRRWHDNVLATASVLEHVAPTATLVVTSSSSVYGGSGSVRDVRACHEDDELDPRGGYARSKVVVERLVQARTGPGPTVVVRPFTVAGEGQRDDMALATWLRAARSGSPVTVFGSLDRRRDVTDVVEVAAAVGRLVEGGHGGTFNLGTGTTHSLSAHLEAVRAVTGHDLDVRVVPAATREVATTCADPTRLDAAVGGLQPTPLVELVARQHARSRRTSRPDAVVPAG